MKMMKHFDKGKITDRSWKRFKYSVGIFMLLGTAAFMSDGVFNSVKNTYIEETT